MMDRSQPQVALGGSEGVLRLGELDVELPELLRVASVPVGAEKVTAACMECPLRTLPLLPDRHRETRTVFSLPFFHGNIKE